MRDSAEVVGVVGELAAHHIAVRESRVLVALCDALLVGDGNDADNRLPCHWCRFLVGPHRVCPFRVYAHQSAVAPCAVAVVIVAHLWRGVRQHDVLSHLAEDHPLDVREIDAHARSVFSLQFDILLHGCHRRGAVYHGILQAVGVEYRGVVAVVNEYNLPALNRLAHREATDAYEKARKQKPSHRLTNLVTFVPFLIIYMPGWSALPFILCPDRL